MSPVEYAKRLAAVKAVDEFVKVIKLNELSSLLIYST
jgi:hypothetical protein